MLGYFSNGDPYAIIGEDRPIFSPVDQHAQFAANTYAGKAAPAGVSPAISALAQMRAQEQEQMAGNLPGLMTSFNPRTPVGYGMIGDQAYVGGKPYAGDPEELRRNNAARAMGYLDRSNAAGTVGSFFQDPRVAGRSPDQMQEMYDAIFGAGRMQQDMLADQLSKLRAAQDPEHYTPVTYRDVDEYQASRTPAAMKMESERLNLYKSQLGVSPLDFLRHTDPNGLTTIPEQLGKNGEVVKPSQTYRLDPAALAAMRRSLNSVWGGGGQAFPDYNHPELARLAELHAKKNAPPEVVPGSMAVPEGSPFDTSMGVPIDPTISPLRQFGRGLGSLATRGAQATEPYVRKWGVDPLEGLGNHMANLPTRIANLFRAQNSQQAPMTLEEMRAIQNSAEGFGPFVY